MRSIRLIYRPCLIGLWSAWDLMLLPGFPKVVCVPVACSLFQGTLLQQPLCEAIHGSSTEQEFGHITGKQFSKGMEARKSQNQTTGQKDTNLFLVPSINTKQRPNSVLEPNGFPSIISSTALTSQWLSPTSPLPTATLTLHSLWASLLTDLHPQCTCQDTTPPPQLFPLQLFLHLFLPLQRSRFHVHYCSCIISFWLQADYS